MPEVIHESRRYRLETEGLAAYVVRRLPYGRARQITELPECLAIWRRLRDIDIRGGCKDLLCRNILEGRLPL